MGDVSVNATQTRFVNTNVGSQEALGNAELQVMQRVKIRQGSDKYTFDGTQFLKDSSGTDFRGPTSQSLTWYQLPLDVREAFLDCTFLILASEVRTENGSPVTDAAHSMSELRSGGYDVEVNSWQNWGR